MTQALKPTREALMDFHRVVRQAANEFHRDTGGQIPSVRIDSFGYTQNGEGQKSVISSVIVECGGLEVSR